LSGARVDFTSSNLAVATISPASAQTDGSGTAQATVLGIASGATVVRASAAGSSNSSTVQVNEPTSVPDLTLWGMLAMVLAILLLVHFGGWRRDRGAH